jgi:hypothetical protein
MPNAAEAMPKALRKIAAAVEGLGHKAVVIGTLAHRAWGSKREAAGVELLVSSDPAHREAILSAARGEGLQQSPDGPLRLQYTDAKLGATATVDLVEARTPFHAQVIGRAQRGNILQTGALVATCEDLILLASDRGVIVELLRGNAGRIDGAYLKREAEAAGIFDRVKLAWQEAKQQG